MAAYYSTPVSAFTMQGGAGWIGCPYGEEESPVKPQFATRYSQTTALLPPFTYVPAVVAPMYGETSNYCVAPCCTGYKGLVPLMPPITMVNNVYAPSQAYVQPAPLLLPAAPIGMKRSSSKDQYKVEWGVFPAVEPVSGQEARQLTTIPPIAGATIDLDAVDHPSYMRPPHREVIQKKPHGVVAGLSSSSPATAPDSGYCSATASPPVVYNVYQLIPAEPMPAPPPLSIEMSGAQVADAVASVIYDIHAGRFGAIGVPSPPRGGRKASSPALDGALFVTTRGEFVHFVRAVLAGTRVKPAVVANAVSYLYDMRLQEELRARSLQLSFVAALSISHKTLDDSPFTTATWAKLARLDLGELRTAERAIFYGLSFDVRPELNRERFIDATNLLLSRLLPDSKGRFLLVDMIESFVLSL